MKFISLACLLTLFLAAAPARAADNVLPPPAGDAFIYFTSDQASAEPDNKKITLQGNVTVIQKTKDGKTRTVTGENISLDQTNTQISSVGPMTVKDGQGNVLTGNNVSVNYTTKDFKAEDISTEYPPLRVLSAKEISSISQKETLRNATLTCCDNPDPHYTLSVGKLTVSPKKRVFGTNAVLRLDGFPIFYLPLFWRSLQSQKPWTTYVDFTQSNKTGFGILTSTVFNPVFNLRPKLNLDYYTNSGLGLGGGLTAVESPTLRGSGEFYFINDQADTADTRILDDSKRWGVQGGYWWEMYDSSDHFNNPDGALYQFQTQFRMVSDPYFYDTFFRGNPYIFMPDQETNFSLSRQTRRSTLRVSYQQKDIFAMDKKEFMAEKRTLPEIKFMLLPFTDPLLKTSNRLEVDFDNTSTLQYKNGMPNEEGPYQRQAHAKWTTEKAFRLSRAFTFTPSVFYDQTITFADSHYKNGQDAWVARVGTDLNLQTHSFLGTTDFGYQFTKRLSTGTLSSDQVSPDKGIELNRLYINNYYRPTFNTYVRFQTGFDLSDYTYSLKDGFGYEQGWDHLKARIEPFLLEWGYNSPNGLFNFFVQDQYDLEEKNINFIAQSNFIYKNQIIGLGFNNFADYTDPGSLYQTDSDRYTITTTWGIRPPGGKWFMDLGIDAVLEPHSLVGFNKMFRFSYTFHDAQTEFTIRDRNDNFSFAFRINILCGGNKRIQGQVPEDTYWYPWRNPGDLRDI